MVCFMSDLSGGLNVIFVGDFWQLDPPEPSGVSISAVPKDLYDPTAERPRHATSEYGLSLFWSFNMREAVQGVTVLTLQERCKDKWYSDLLDECRELKLSENNYNFLHGFPTAVPGSWCLGQDGSHKPSCGVPKCVALAERVASAGGSASAGKSIFWM